MKISFAKQDKTDLQDLAVLEELFLGHVLPTSPSREWSGTPCPKQHRQEVLDDQT